VQTAWLRPATPYSGITLPDRDRSDGAHKEHEMVRPNEDIERPDAGEQPDVERETLPEEDGADEDAGVEQTPPDADDERSEE
jgi:hypothetical protein